MTRVLTTEKDPVRAAMSAAMKLVKKAADEARGDVRTSCTVMIDHLDLAGASLTLANEWYSGLLKEEAANLRVDAPKPKPVRHECGRCEDTIRPGDVTVCSGCEREICLTCMGDDGVCVDCEEEA